MLKLPKDLADDPHHDAIVAALITNAQKLWSNGRVLVPTLPFSPRLTDELKRALAHRQAAQGLELIGDELAREQKGLDALQDKLGGAKQGSRLSRLLFMANDGSERFYRDCDTLLSRYAQRLVGCRLAISGNEMGTALAGEGRVVRAVMVFDKKAASKALLALV